MVMVGVRVGVRVNYFRDSFSVLLRAQHYSMLMTSVPYPRPLLIKGVLVEFQGEIFFNEF